MKSNTNSFTDINRALLKSSMYLLKEYKNHNVIDPQRFSRLFKRAQIHLRKFYEVPVLICLDSALYLSYEQKILWLDCLRVTIDGEESLRQLRTSLNSMKPLIK